MQIAEHNVGYLMNTGVIRLFPERISRTFESQGLNISGKMMEQNFMMTVFASDDLSPSLTRLVFSRCFFSR